MNMSFGLVATLSTSQKLTPQMQQAIKLLQLSSLELAQEVQTKLDSNPLLERIEDDEDDHYNDDSSSLHEAIAESLTLEMWNSNAASSAAADDHFSSGAESYNDSNTYNDSEAYNDSDDNSFSDSFDKLQQSGIDDSVMDSGDINNDYQDIDNDFTHFVTGNYASSAAVGGSATIGELDDYQGSTNASIQDHVRWQLNFKHLSDIDILIANYLMDSMDDMGFVQLDIDELLQSFATMASFYQWDDHVEHDEIQAVLRVIQSCDPLGVGARNLSECLAIQLSKLDRNTPHLAHARALLSASEHLVSNNIKALTEATGLLPEHITPALNLLRTLNPSPGLSFQSSQPDYTQPPVSYDIPDILVSPISSSNMNPSNMKHNNTNKEANATEQNEGWYVRLNPETLPKLRVNQEYASLVKRGDNSPDNQYLRDNLLDARLFIRSIEERNQNLLKVATSIVRHQQEYLQHGATSMQPLILKEVAEEVGLHESTVSRLTTSKTILTPQGLFSLKHFFSSHVSSNDGDISSTAISAMIKQLIADENPKKPLSDSRIQAQLLADGIDIARRTVAKYREAMNIGSSTQRKQKY
ncbi:RNA polymerase factor sigma-54 [Psychrobacter urativorans]|uniref:RNA polymerase sigma-54 factor n=1 Tax=Psychrobacter urativorans TaxID=45610 RepID=A0A0M4T2P9_9GAMM|nr:RNA polymerase sigma-54 factor [Psychrobacter urativorans]ALF59915.1 RNA polymerase sigma-54 factor [Psychrobacter urativorans]